MSLDSTFLSEIAIITVAALVFSLFFARFRLPVVGGQILAGMIIGPHLLGFVSDSFLISAISQLGIILLLFILGLELDPKEIRGVVAKIGGLTAVEVAISVAIIYEGVFFFAHDGASSVIVAVSLAFASTAVVGRLLLDNFGGDSEKNDYQKILVSVMVMEDVVAIVFLVFIPDISGGGIEPVLALVEIALKGAGLLVVSYVSGTYLVPRVINYFASFEVESEDVPFLFSLGLGVIFGAIASYLGFSPAIGSFIIGLSLRGKYSKFVSRRIRPIRDLFLILFFVSMGMLIDPVAATVVPLFYAIILIAIAAKWIGAYVGGSLFSIGMAPTRLATWLSPRGEFSMIIAETGLAAGLISEGMFSVIGIVVIITTLVAPVYLVAKMPHRGKAEFPFVPKGD